MSEENEKKYVLSGREFSNEDLALLSVASALEKKATRPVIMDLRHLDAFSEFFAIVSAANARQAYAIAQEIKVFFKKAFGLHPLSIDGLETCNWVLIDYGFLFVHIFQEPTREMYQLEKLWGKSRSLAFTEEQCAKLHQEVLSLIPHESSDENQDDLQSSSSHTA